jgi:hypothetical protein
MAAIRGGNFNNTANAGVFYLNVNNAPSNANNNIGFRACKSGYPARRAEGFSARSAHVTWNHDPHRRPTERPGVKNKKRGCAPGRETERDASTRAGGRR